MSHGFIINYLFDIFHRKNIDNCWYALHTVGFPLHVTFYRKLLSCNDVQMSVHVRAMLVVPLTSISMARDQEMYTHISRNNRHLC